MPYRNTEVPGAQAVRYKGRDAVGPGRFYQLCALRGGNYQQFFQEEIKSKEVASLSVC